MLVIPAIDVKDGKCVRLSEGRKESVRIYDASPLKVAESFVSAGAQWIHVVDLDGAFAGKVSRNRQLAREIISRFEVNVQFGGGLRTLDDASEMIAAGAARVVIGTIAAERPEILGEMIGRFGSRISVAVDARNGDVMLRGWEAPGKIRAFDMARSLAALGVSRIIYTDIARDGMLTGVNIEQTCAVARAAQIPVTASGGVASLDDIRRLVSLPERLVDSVIVGKAIYEGRFSVAEALRVANEI